MSFPESPATRLLARLVNATIEPSAEMLRGLVVDLLQPTVDDLMNQLGSSAFVNTHVAQRYWRDFGTGVRHAVFHGDSSYEIAGRQILGVEPNLVPAEMI